MDEKNILSVIIKISKLKKIVALHRMVFLFYNTKFIHHRVRNSFFELLMLPFKFCVKLTYFSSYFYFSFRYELLRTWSYYRWSIKIWKTDQCEEHDGCISYVGFSHHKYNILNDGRFRNFKSTEMHCRCEFMFEKCLSTTLVPRFVGPILYSINICIHFSCLSIRKKTNK